jgi:hypothetical protein
MTVDAPESDRSGTTSDVRIAILSSDRGGHLQTLLEDPVVGQWVALVVADRPDAYAIRHAEWHGVSAAALRAGKSNPTSLTSLWYGCLRSIRSTTSS